MSFPTPEKGVPRYEVMFWHPELKKYVFGLPHEDLERAKRHVDGTVFQAYAYDRRTGKPIHTNQAALEAKTGEVIATNQQQLENEESK